MALFDKRLLTKNIENIIDKFLEEKLISIKNEEVSMKDFIDSVDNDFDSGDLSDEIYKYVTQDYLENIRYSYSYDFGFSTTKCDKCGHREGKWINRNNHNIINDNELCGKHIFVPE